MPALVLLIGGGIPGVVLLSRGDRVGRLIGLQLLSVIVVLELLLLAHVLGRPAYLIVPLVLVVLSFAGSLVFTRGVGSRP